MNIHVPQNSGAICEIGTIATTSQHLISDQNNGPCMGCVQNTLVCTYLITKTYKNIENYFNVSYNQKNYYLIKTSDFNDAVVLCDMEPSRYISLVKRAKKYYPEFIDDNKFKEYIPGKIVVSILFPEWLWWSRKTNTLDSHPVVFIENGIITPESGPICKKCIGGTGGSILQPLWKMNPQIAANLITECQYMASLIISRIGFSMGASDCLSTKQDEISDALNRTMIECELIINSNKTPQEKETALNSSLNKAMSVAPVLAKKYMNKNDKNQLVIMKESGAKGSDTNNGQITGFAGQQNLSGKRLELTISHGKRTLPHFPHNDLRPVSRGFVSHSFLDGLTPSEAWHHAVGGRRGVADTGTKTAETGYMQKKAIKKMQDFMTYEDSSVRDCNNNIIQFLYGGDGFNAKHLTSTEGFEYPWVCNPYFVANNINSKYLLKIDNIKNESKRFLNEIEIEYILDHIFAGSKKTKNSKINLVATNNFHIITKYFLKNISLYEPVIGDFLIEYTDLFNFTKITKGFMVGHIAAESIGEPITQLTLNSVIWETQINIYHGNSSNPKTHFIGEFIDKFINCISPDKIVYYQNNNTEWVDISRGKIFIQTVDEDGRRYYKLIEAITRHNPGGNLVKVKTKSGREVTVTKSKSLLKIIDNKLIPIEGDKVKIGDFLPVIPNKIETNYALINDIFCDEIIEITEIEESSLKHPKVYDFTVADTYNFTISNGLCLRDTFHSAGMSAKDVTLGVPRFKELLNATKKPSKPTMTIYLKNPITPTANSISVENKIKANILANKILYLNIENFIDSVTLYKKNEDIKESEAATLFYNYEVYIQDEILNFYSQHILKVDLNNIVEKSDWIIRLKFNMDELYSKGVLLKDIAEKINYSSITSPNTKFLTAIPYPNYMGIIDVFQNTNQIQTYMCKEKIIGNFGSDDIINKNTQSYFITRDVLIPYIYTTKISGIENIKKTFVNIDEIYKTNNIVIDTQGINLSTVLSLSDIIDITKTICDDMWSLFRCFGIEAARYFLIKEMIKILSFDGTYINPRHIILLVDAMTNTGTITSVSREGLDRVVIGPISKLMFEKPVSNITISAVSGEHDMLKGTSASVFMGLLSNYGCPTVKVCDGDMPKDEPF